MSININFAAENICGYEKAKTHMLSCDCHLISCLENKIVVFQLLSFGLFVGCQSNSVW